MDFSHLDASGAPRMVDVSAKTETKRTAIARSVVHISASTLELLKAKALPKGDVLTVAQIAGIMAAKRTSEFIPMCHPLALTHTDVRFLVRDEPPSVIIEASASTSDRTGVEMEAIIGAQIAAATIYDTVKAVLQELQLDAALGRLQKNEEAFAVQPRDLTMDQSRCKAAGILFPTTKEGLRSALKAEM